MPCRGRSCTIRPLPADWNSASSRTLRKPPLVARWSVFCIPDSVFSSCADLEAPTFRTDVLSLGLAQEFARTLKPVVAGTLCSDFVIKGGLQQMMVPEYLQRKRDVMTDMESYGFVQAAAVCADGGDIVVVRGISDLANEDKQRLEASVCDASLPLSSSNESINSSKRGFSLVHAVRETNPADGGTERHAGAPGVLCPGAGVPSQCRL